MDILSFPTVFRGSQLSLGYRNVFNNGSPNEQLDRLKEREELLEARRKALCFGGKSGDPDSQEAGDTSRGDFATADDEEDDEDMDMASTTSYSINEPSDVPEDDADEEIPLDDSEAEESLPLSQEAQVVTLDVDGEVEVEDPTVLTPDDLDGGNEAQQVNLEEFILEDTDDDI